MLEQAFFPQRPESRPVVYAYEFIGVASHQGYIKVGYTERNVETRVKEQTHTAAVPYRILGEWSAMKNDGSCFTDHDVHAVLKATGKRQLNAGEDRNEWFRCSLADVRAAVVAVKNGTENVEDRTQTFGMRPEQAQAVEKTMRYFQAVQKEEGGRIPKFLWNAKMRFGKTFAAYQLAKKMGMKRVLILTFKPAVQTAWREDLMTHVDFEGWQFITRPTDPHGPTNDEQYRKADKNRPIVCFGSFQDFLGVNRDTGGIKANNEWVHATNWDLVIFDEYHFGAWKDNARKLFESDEDAFEEDLSKYDAGNAYDETWLPITSEYYLYLSGTPFRALNSGEFIEEQTGEQKLREQIDLEGALEAVLGQRPFLLRAAGVVGEDVDPVVLPEFRREPHDVGELGVVGEVIRTAEFCGDLLGLLGIAPDEDHAVSRPDEGARGGGADPVAAPCDNDGFPVFGLHILPFRPAVPHGERSVFLADSPLSGRAKQRRRPRRSGTPPIVIWRIIPRSFRQVSPLRRARRVQPQGLLPSRQGLPSSRRERPRLQPPRRR